MSKLSVSADAPTVTVAVVVSSAAGGAGAAVVNSTNSTSVVLRNGQVPIEYQIDAGSWVEMEEDSSTELDLNLSTSTFKTRKAAGYGNGALEMDITSVAGTFRAGNEPTALNGLVVNTPTLAADAYTLALTDMGEQVDMVSANANTCNIPTNAVAAFPIGTVIWVRMAGAGATTIAGAGVTLVKPAAKSLTISAQYELARLHKTAVDTWSVNAS